MNIYYQGTDITDMVQTKECIVRDTCGDRCDSIEIVFENAAGWYRWGPKKDDIIKVTSGAYDSGAMFVNTILPENGRFRIMATSLPVGARQKEFKSFGNKTIEEILRQCSAKTGMGYQVFGIEKTTNIPYIERDMEGCAAFLSRVLTLEGAKLKCINGMFTAIGILYAQNLDPVRTMTVSANQEGVTYTRGGMRQKAITVYSPYGKARAEDKSVLSGDENTVPLPVLNDIQAGRWARGKLIDENRKCECVNASMSFDPYFTAMSRVDIQGGTDADGEWIIDDVQHDLVNSRTKATLRRCIVTVQ